MINYKVVIATKGRADRVTTIPLFLFRKNIYLFVDSKEEVSEYRRYNKDVNIVVSGRNGVANTMNFAMDYFKKDENLVFACDDVRNIRTSEAYRTGKRKRMDLTPNMVENFICNAFTYAKKYDVNMWGISPANDGLLNLKYQVSFYNFIVGTLWGWRNRELRLSNKIQRKHDYEFTVQNLYEYGKVLRFDGIMTRTDFKNTKGGGCEGTAVDDLGKKACDYLVKTYPSCFSYHKKRKNEVNFRYKSGKTSRTEEIDYKKLLESRI